MKLTHALLATFIISTAILGGCASTGSTESAAEAKPSAEQMAAFDQQYAEVEALRKKADSVGGEWRDVGKFMKEAKAAAADGDFDKASKLLAKAKFQCEVGYKQAMERKGVSPVY